nr:transposase (putative), gypsy type [Tanacetum cinerariifolium]GEZ71439.1 transposase (putative), gypsy type [Tanacetum cinerariifolium]
MDLFGLIRAPNPTKVKTGSHPRAPHELPLLTLTASWVIEMDEPAVATDSSGVPSAIEKSPLDFVDEAEASGRETAAPELPPPKESRKRGPEGVDANAPPKSLWRDHTDRPLGSSCGGKSLAAMQLCLDSKVFMSEGVPDDVSDPDPLAFAGAPSYPPVDVAQAAEGKNAELMRELEYIRAQFSGLKVSNEHLSQRVTALQEQVSEEEKLKAAFEEFKRYEDDRVEKRCAKLDARLDSLSIDFDEELYPHMLTAIAGRRWVIEHGLRLAMMKCPESLEMRQAFVDVVSAGVAKGMSEGLKHGVEHGRSQLELESIEAYDPEAEAKFVAALQSLKDLKFSLLDQLEGLKDAPMDVIMAALYLENAIAANISRAEKKKKCRIVCQTHGVGSAHHARSDGILVSIPSVVP